MAFLLFVASGQPLLAYAHTPLATLWAGGGSTWIIPHWPIKVSVFSASLRDDGVLQLEGDAVKATHIPNFCEAHHRDDACTA